MMSLLLLVFSNNPSNLLLNIVKDTTISTIDNVAFDDEPIVLDENGRKLDNDVIYIFAPEMHVGNIDYTIKQFTEKETKEPPEVNDVSYTRYVTELLNVRSEPNTDSEILGKLKIKTEVNVTGEVVDDNWVEIAYKDNIGYICSDYLVDSVEGIENFTYNWDWNGPKLNKYSGWVKGPSGKETYYNLDMSRIVRMMQARGFGEYWVRSDGAKMLGDYVMVAANLTVHPRGSLVETSLGTGLVCDTGSFAYSDPEQIDTAVTWVK